MELPPPAIDLPPRPIPVVGLTGGIGAGKSSVARLLRGLGVPVIDADQLARRVVEPGQEGLQAVVRRFGQEMLQADGTLDRGKLARVVFAKASELEALNDITHPEILRAAAREIQRLAEVGYRWAVYEAALIVDNSLHPGLDLLVLVDAPEPARLRRVMDRDRRSAQEVLARMATQVRPQRLREAADLIIDNGGSAAELSEATERAFAALVERFGPLRG